MVNELHGLVSEYLIRAAKPTRMVFDDFVFLFLFVNTCFIIYDVNIARIWRAAFVLMSEVKEAFFSLFTQNKDRIQGCFVCC